MKFYLFFFFEDYSPRYILHNDELLDISIQLFQSILKFIFMNSFLARFLDAPFYN